MTALHRLGNEILGLFVDDWSFAAAIVVWIASITLANRFAPVAGTWLGPLLFAGLSLALLANVVRESKKRQQRH